MNARRNEIRARWHAEGKCYECGSDEANGMYRCKKCNARKAARKKAKARGEEPKGRPEPLKEADHDVRFWLSKDVMQRFRSELQRFQITFKHGSIHGQRMADLLRGFIVHGLRVRGMPDRGSIRRYRQNEIPREEIRVSFTGDEYEEIAKLSEPSGFKLSTIISLIVEREAEVRDRLPHEPKLDGLRGGVVLTKDWRFQRVPGFLYTTKTAPICTGYDSLRDIIHMPPKDDFPEEEPQRRRVVRVRLSEDEYQSFELLRKNHFKWVPTRSDLFREMLYEIADQKWFDLRERYDKYMLEMSRLLDRSIELERETKEAKSKRKRAERNQNMLAVWAIESMEQNVAFRMKLMKAGIIPSEEDTIAAGEIVEKKWKECGDNMRAIYDTSIYEQLLLVEKMSRKARREWHSRLATQLKTMVESSRKELRDLREREKANEKKDLN